MKRGTVQRLAAFIPAVVIGLAAGIGINYWRHRSNSDAPAPANTASHVTYDRPLERKSGLRSAPADPAAADEIIRRIQNARIADSPLRSDLATEAVVAGLTWPDFLSLLASGRIPKEVLASDALHELFRTWGATDRRQALGVAIALPDDARRSALRSVLHGLTATEFRNLTKDWAVLPKLRRRELLDQAVASVARTSASDALGLLKDLPLDKEDAESLATATYAALLRDSAEKPGEWEKVFQLVMGTAKTLPPDKLDSFLRESLSGLNSERAAAAWPAIAGSGISTAAQHTFLHQWSQTDPNAALAAAVSQFPPDRADGSAQRLYNDLAIQSAVYLQLLDEKRRTDPEAWRDLAANVPPGAGRDAFVAGLVHQAASGNPSLAIQLLPEVTAEHRAQTINTIAELWTASNAVAASEWVNSLPSGPDRDLAAAGFVRRLAESDPERAAQWAVSISSESERRSALRKVHDTWQRLDSAAASHWLQSESRLTPEDMAALKTR
jgi:hypothetical protein